MWSQKTRIYHYSVIYAWTLVTIGSTMCFDKSNEINCQENFYQTFHEYFVKSLMRRLQKGYGSVVTNFYEKFQVIIKILL